MGKGIGITKREAIAQAAANCFLLEIVAPASARKIFRVMQEIESWCRGIQVVKEGNGPYSQQKKSATVRVEYWVFGNSNDKFFVDVNLESGDQYPEGEDAKSHFWRENWPWRPVSVATSDGSMMAKVEDDWSFNFTIMDYHFWVDYLRTY